MKIKKIVSVSVAAATMFAGLCELPFEALHTHAAEVVKNDFEVNYDGWYADGDNASLNAEDGVGKDGSRALVLSGRKSQDEGVSSSKGFYLSGGKYYDYSIMVKSKNAEKFKLTLLTKDEKTGASNLVTLAAKKSYAGKWTKLSGTYKAPKNSYEFKLNVTTDSLSDFTIDDVEITSKEDSKIVSAATTEKGLKDEFAGYYKVGNILNGSTVKNSAITANIIKNYNSIECENETKPDATLVQSGSSDTNIRVHLNSAAAIMDFCVKNNIAMRGHAFVWHSQTPSWFFKSNFQNNGSWVSPQVMDQRLESYIKNMFAAIKQQYPSLNLYSYDVCNECISDDSTRTSNGKDGARQAGDNNVTGGTSSWVSVYGNNSFVEKAFTFAKKYRPADCHLYYNDYNEYWDHKENSIYNMCKNLYNKGLLDGVGMQSHVPANATGFAGTDAYTAAMDKYLSIGCNVTVTELDISLEDGKYSLTDQANKYKAIFKHAMDVNSSGKYKGKVEAVCIWGPNDANSWLKAGSNALLFDSNNQPKPAYNALISMIPQSQWGNGAESLKPLKPNEYGWYFDDGFEGSTCDWETRGQDKIMTSGKTAYVGNEALLVKERTDAWNGAAKVLDPVTFVPGKEYSFSVNVTYFEGDDTDHFNLKLEYTDKNGKTQYSTISEGTVGKGKWTQLSNKNYKIPSDASNVKVYVETTKTTNNFYIDEFIAAVAGTGIKGAGEYKAPETTTTTTTTKKPDVKPILRGDLNFDGKINAGDLSLAKSGLAKKFKNDTVKAAADVDESGTVNSADIKYLQQFILGKIKTFPKAPKPVTTTTKAVTTTIKNNSLPQVDTAKMQKLFAGVSLQSSYKKDGENNPLYTQRFGADPGVMEYNGRIYVYMTNDVVERDSSGKVKENSYSLVNKINCISSDDLVNWTDHGAIPVAGENGIAKWGGNSWAPCAAHKKINGKEKFFLYYANGGNGIGVLTADSPTGPWSDPLGKALISRQTPNCNVPWLFDPAVMVDSDGTGYLAFGGGVPTGQQAHPKSSRVVKLNSDMISISGTPQTIDAPYLFEDSGINKIGNKYYYTYCSNWNTSGNQYGLTSGAIEYMVADNPLGPYTYGGELFKNEGTFFGLYGNNHHSIGQLNGKLYLFYHNRPVEKAMGISGNYRSPQVDAITMNGTKINPVVGTMKGVKQLKSQDPYLTHQAESMSNQSKDIVVNGLGNTTVTGKKGSWFKYSWLNFTGGAHTFKIRASSPNGAAIKVCTDPSNSDTIAYVEIPGTNKMTDIEVPVVKSTTAQTDIYFIYSGDATVDSWQFSKISS